jgi:TfoX/Sxy family transcriptional regulator of competence genes
MAYDEGLAERIRGVLDERRDVTEKRMFGGVAFMVGGRMCVGIVKDELMVRVGAQRHDDLVRRPHARPMDFTGKPMRGFLFVAPRGFESDTDLERWVGQGIEHALSLPDKPARVKRPATKAARRAAPARAARSRARR